MSASSPADTDASASATDTPATAPAIDEHDNGIYADDDADEDADEDEDEDDVDDSSAKRTRTERLIDDIAEDEDDPDADDDDDYDEDADIDDTGDFISNEVERKKRGVEGREDEDDTMHLSLDQLREQQEAERLVRELEDRYGAEGDEEVDLNQLSDDDYDDDLMYGEGVVGEGGAGRSASILPSIKDPKLWLVRCDPGQEDLMCLSLLRRFLTKQNSDDPLFIHSAFTTPASKGYIYIEADKEVHVKRAIRGLRALKWWKLQLIPIAQMVSAVKFTDEVPTIRRRQWVRIKSGLYRGDLAQVYRLSDQNTIVTVKLIPRLDLSALESGESGGGRKRKRPFTRYSIDRPPQALFNRDELVRKKVDVGQIAQHPSDRKRYDTLGNNRYRHGYLYKDMRYTGLHVDNIQPTEDEADRFLARIRGDSDEDEDDIQPLPAATPSRATQKPQFAIGDHVIVAEGAMKNITGRIISVPSSTHCTIQPDPGQPITIKLEVMMKEIKKFFRLGDHVKVIAGMYKDETGMITQVQSAADTVSIYSDTSLRELLVHCADVIESSEVSSGRESLGTYSLYDLVQLTDTIVGVITKVEVASFKVLTNRGVTETVKLQQIGKKRYSRYAAALDSASNQITKDDVVNVNAGEHKGKQGTIKHIYRHFLFLFSRQVTENSGMFVVPAKQVTLVGQTYQRRSIVPQSPQVGLGVEDNTALKGTPAARTSAVMGPPAAVPRRRVGDRHPLVGKTVMITGGPYKSFMGIVLEVTELNVKVELHALARKVMVNLHDISERTSQTHAAQAAAKAEARDFLAGSQTPLLGGRTPAYELGSSTPAHDAFGSQTPAYNYGSSTPSRDAWSAQTPARVFDEDEHEQEEEDEWKQDYAAPHTLNVKTPISQRTEGEADLEEEEERTDRRLPRIPARASGQQSALDRAHRPLTTPASHALSRQEDDESASLPVFPVGCKVLVSPGADTNSKTVMGVVVKHLPDGSMKIHVDGSLRDSFLSLSRGARHRVSGVVPDKNDQIIVVSGDSNVGQVGNLIGINQGSEECIVNIGGDILILHLRTMCKYERYKG